MVVFQPQAAGSKRIKLTKGRSKTIRITISNTEVGDITGSKLWLTVKRDPEDNDTSALITKKSLNNGGSDSEAFVFDGPNRIVQFFFVPADAALIEAPASYHVDAVIELPSGDKLQLLEPYLLELQLPVTVTV